MELATLERHWNEFGRTDPMWAILTDGPGGNRWGADAFFAAGLPTVDYVLRRAGELGLPAERRRALDFGCGLGRLTQALAHHFEHVDGVDIAATMIDGAREHNRHGERVAYHVNTASDLSLFADDSFDFVFTYVVLQHIHPRYTLRYLLEFLRILKPGGLLAFQLPCHEAPPPALPEGAHLASLEPRVATVEAVAGTRTIVPVTVRNASRCPWPLQIDGRDVVLRLGNHWLDDHGATISFDDGRAGLPVDLPPDASVDVDLAVTAPSVPGTYTLELDLVHEGNCWFAQRGSPVARVQTVVRRPDGEAVPADDEAADEEPFVPVMEVHGIREPVVVGVLEASDATVVARDPDGAAFGWEGRLYFVTK
jgi:SAM-dependent methyltransferase